MKSKLKIFLSVVLMSIASTSYAQTSLHIYGKSWHSGSESYRETNTGMGIEQRINSKWSIALGTFQNSLDRQSVIGFGKYHWREYGNWQINVNVGAVTGYNSMKVAPAVLPEVCWQWVCMMGIPAVGSETSAAAAIYLRIPL